MDRVTQEQDGSYHWSCSIDKEFHRKSVNKGLWGAVIIVVFILLIWLFISKSSDQAVSLREPLIVIGVVLVIALPLLYLSGMAEDPHEQYVMNGEYVRSGYGKSSVFSEFGNTESVEITAKYIELAGKRGTNRIYVPEADMDLVRDHILARVPKDAEIRARRG